MFGFPIGRTARRAVDSPEPAKAVRSQSELSEWMIRWAPGSAVQSPRRDRARRSLWNRRAPEQTTAGRVRVPAPGNPKTCW